MAASRKLLTEREYNRIVKKGPDAMAKALREYVARPQGRKPGEVKPMTDAERARRYRERKLSKTVITT